MTDTQQRLHELGEVTGRRWPGSELVTTRHEDGGARRRMYVQHEGAVVADSGWCEGTEAALDALEQAVADAPQIAPERRPRRKRS